MNPARAVAASLIYLALHSCSGSRANLHPTPEPPLQTIQQGGITLQLGRSVSNEQAGLIRSALERLETLKLKPKSARQKTAFRRAFQSESLEAVKSFLKERLRVVVGFQKGFSEENAVVALENISNKLTGYRLLAQYHLEPKFYDSLDGIPVDFSLERLGWLEVHPSFKSDPYSRTAVTTLKDLVHEARHSDCTGGALLRKKDAPPKREDSPMDEQLEVKANMVCFHPHAVCPGDPPESNRACDNHPWGSYTFEYLVLREITLRCQNCTEMEDFLARFDTIFRAGRLMYLPKALFAELRGLQDKMDGWNKSGVGLKNSTVEKTLQKLDRYLLSNALPDPDLSSQPYVE